MTALHPAVVDWEPPGAAVQQIEVTSEQLNGRACVRCGSRLDGLMSAGYVFTRTVDGGRLPWPVRACPHHAGSAGVAA